MPQPQSPQPITANGLTQSHTPSTQYPITFLPPVNKIDHNTAPNMIGRKYSYDTAHTIPVNTFASMPTVPYHVAPTRFAHNYTTHCKLCAVPTLVHTQYPVTPIKVSPHDATHHIMYCPVHRTPSIATKTDAYDLPLLNMALPRHATLANITQTRALVESTPAKTITHRTPTSTGHTPNITLVPVTHLPLFTWLETMATHMTNYGHTSVHVHCNTCHTTATLTITNKLSNLGVHYCPYCASKNIIITPSDSAGSNDMANATFTQLASHYNLHPYFIEACYTLWVTHYQTIHATFADYMAQLPDRLKAELTQ